MGDFYGTGIEIWAGFGLIGITEKKKIWANYEQLFKPLFSSFHGKKNKKHISVLTKKLHIMKFFSLKNSKNIFFKTL